MSWHLWVIGWVKLYWANHDQYYVKSSERLRDYAFTVQGHDGKIIRIKLVEADTEKDNVKAKADEERRFVLDAAQPLAVVDGELHIRFFYVPAGKQTQEALNDEAVKTIFQQAAFKDWLAALRVKTPTEKNPNRTLLEKHLNDYTARHTFDYFIHKDLGGFLRRELDFYIKNEVLYLDDIDDAAFAVTEQHLRKIKVIRTIALKIIRLLAQIEDFQKKLWLKKKFVVETQYCITLDRVPEALYPEIAANPAQHDEWVKLFAINEIKKDLENPGYAKPLTVDFIKANDKLVLDTRFFDEGFKDRLLTSIKVDFDEQRDGLLIQADNFDSLQLIEGRFSRGIECICIDPPYNTGGDGFCYKDGFKRASWLSQQAQLMPNARHLLVDDGSFFAFCDENAIRDYSLLLESLFGNANFVETIIWNKRIPKNDKGIGNIHDFILLLCNNFKLRGQNDKPYKMRKDEIEEIYELINKLKNNGKTIAESQLELKKFYRKQGYDRGITLYCELDPTFRVWGKINMSWPNNNNGPCYKVISPVTGKEVPVPDNGWRWKEETFRQAEANGPTYLLHDGSIMKGRIWYSTRETIQPSSITYLDEVEEFLLRSILSVKSDGNLTLERLGIGGIFDHPKSVLLIERLIYSIGNKDGVILDYFSGSGTTGHAVINLNRNDNGQRKYILVEMGDQFNTVLKPRIAKVVYADNWEDGKPTARNTGISHCSKYLRLESYEDALNNLILKDRKKPQQNLLNENPTLREDYLLGYWLDIETADSPSLLNIDQFEDPFNYQLNIATGSVGAFKPTRVDLVETFNYLIGLRVKHTDTLRGFKVITGTNPKDESVLIIWRNLKEKDNAALEDFLNKQQYNPRDTEFDHLYVNGDHTLDDPHSKVKMIEIEFKRLMFDTQDV